MQAETKVEGKTDNFYNKMQSALRSDIVVKAPTAYEEALAAVARPVSQRELSELEDEFWRLGNFRLEKKE